MASVQRLHRIRPSCLLCRHVNSSTTILNHGNRYLQQDSQSKSFLEQQKASVNDYWSSLNAKYDTLRSSALEALKLPEIANRLPQFLSELKDSFEFKDGSIGANVLDEVKNDPHAHESAHVRRGSELCDKELEFVARRRQFTAKSLARYLRLDEKDVHPDDVPQIGIAASGGGLRACLNTTSYYEIMQDEGILDLTTYLAGISGSTWSQALFYSKSMGNRRPAKSLDHLKNRLTTHIADPVSILQTLQEYEICKYVLRGVLQRFHAGSKDLGIIELYGLILTARLFVPESISTLHHEDLLISAQAKYLENGHAPMPLYSCVRQGRLDSSKKDVEVRSSKRNSEQNVLSDESYFQFYEFSPYEFGTEESETWIPTWAVGRKFEDGESLDTQPEISLSTLLGTFSSAFCASLSAYIQEIRPLLPKENGILTQLDEQIASREARLQAIHFIDATKIPNYAVGLQLEPGMPAEMSTIEDLELCDAGMANNMPFYPLLRRNCDIIIAIDSSADINTTPWFSRTEGYAKKRNIKSWPIGIGWPKQEDQTDQGLKDATASSPADASNKLHDAVSARYGLDGVNVWIGQSTEASSGTASASDADTETDSFLKAQRIDDDWDVVSNSTGLMLIYLPMLPHPEVVGVDPGSSEYLSTWNFIYTPEQVNNVRKLARANFDSSRVKNAIRAMYMRKRESRLSRTTP